MNMGFFKAYDMRGTFGVDFDLPLVYRIGCVLPGVISEIQNPKSDAQSPALRIVVGRDARKTGEAIRDALVAGLRDAGADVVDLGLATTPEVYHFTAEDGFDGGVMVTASHNPPGDNGLKVSIRGARPMGYDSGLAEVERRAKMITDCAPRITHDEAQTVNHASCSRYAAYLAARFAGAEGLRYAVDCSDGATSLFVHDLFKGARFLNDVPDGAFPHHAPNPLLAAARDQIAAVVRAEGLDCGVVFDGDGDRCVFVDETGAFVQPDFLIPELAAACLVQTPPAPGETPAIIHDVRTSRAAIERLAAMGCRPVMGKVGHAYAKKLLRETNAPCGGELAGHYYMRDFHGCDSGLLAAARLLDRFAAAKRRGLSVSEVLAPVRDKYANSGEINFRVADKDAAIKRVLAAARAFGEERGRCTLDGVRLEFDAGWVCVRASNTEPYLRLLVECDTAERLAVWRLALENAVSQTD